MATGTSNRSRQILLANLPKRGWTVSGMVATMEGYTVECRDESWVLFKGSATDSEKKEIATGAYGSSQMGDIRAALKRDGFDMAVIPQGAKAPAQKSAESTEAAGKKRAESMAKTMDTKRDAFVTFATEEQGWTKTDTEDKLEKGEFELNLKKARWMLTKKGDATALVTGRYINSEYAAIEEALNQE